MSSPTSPGHADHRTRNGVLAVVGAFAIWGILPLYLKPLNSIAALQIAAWRYLMGCMTVIGWVAWRGELPQVWHIFTRPALLRPLVLTAVLLAVNWTLYAWGVSHGQVLFTSLGYFIGPLVNVLLGILVLSERLNRAQWTAVIIAAAGVVILTVQTGHLPWLSLVLAVTFSLYGLLRKMAAAGPLPGLAVETLLMAPLAGIYLLLMQHQHGDFAHYSALMLVLLFCSGIVTVVPLTLFNYGAQRIDYATTGMVQYLGPTLQFLIGVFVYKEALSSARLLCFAMIWLALAIYAGDGLWRSRAMRAPETP
ncbi:MAG: EamA family transporter RarD [Steroidobacteraceae bacterium]